MIFPIFLLLLMLLHFQRLWKIRKSLILSQKLKSKYLSLPIIGHAYMFVGTAEGRFKAFQKFGREGIKSKYGIIGAWLGYQYFNYITDPIVAKVVSKESLGKTDLANLARNLIGNGSIFAPVNIWRLRRKVLAPTFSPRNLNGFVEIFAEQSMVTMNCLKSKVGTGTFSICKDITAYTMEAACRSVLGVKINVQKQKCHPFMVAYDKYFSILSVRLVQPWLHWDFLYKLMPVYQEVKRNIKIIHDFVDDIIRRKKTMANHDYVTESSPNTNNDVRVTTFLDLLRKSSGGSKYTDVEIREELLVLILAGTDTSAVGTSFVIVMLSRYMSIQEKVYEELRLIFEDSKRPITVEDLLRLEYTEAVIKETLRLYPPAPIIARENDNDVKINSNITLPAGSNNIIDIWAIHQNPKYWGADAEEYNPDRFLNGTVGPDSAFIPFGYGPRNCLGYKYAMMSMKVAVATLVREYKVLPPSDMSADDLRRPLRLEFNIMMKDVDNFHVRLEHRN